MKGKYRNYKHQTAKISYDINRASPIKFATRNAKKILLETQILIINLDSLGEVLYDDRPVANCQTKISSYQYSMDYKQESRNQTWSAFVKIYILKLGFLDGLQDFQIATLTSFFIYSLNFLNYGNSSGKMGVRILDLGCGSRKNSNALGVDINRNSNADVYL